jgi:hypothetical protein
MRRPVFGLLALSLLASACQTSFGAPDAPNRLKKPATASSVKPSAKPSTGAANPLANGSAAPKASPTPSVPMTALKGLLKMDASFVVSAGGANVVSAGGANVVSAGGGNLIKVGGQVISAGGANVISAGGANYRTQAISVALGTMLPAQGMAVVAVSLRTGKPLGDAVLTDEAGRYTLEIPKSETGNVRVVAAVPGKSADDKILDNPGLRSELLTPAKSASGAAAEQVVDDDATTVSRYFRQAFVNRLDELLTRTEPSRPDPNPLVAESQGALEQAGLDAKTHALPVEVRRELAGRMADNFIYFVDFESAKVKGVTGWSNTTDERCFPAFLDIMRQVREAAVKKLLSQQDFFDQKPYLLSANAGTTPPKYLIRRASDLGNFCVEEYLSRSGKLAGIRPVLADIGVPADQEFRLEGADWGISTQMGYTLALNPEVKNTLIKLIQESANR